MMNIAKIIEFLNHEENNRLKSELEKSQEDTVKESNNTISDAMVSTMSQMIDLYGLMPSDRISDILYDMYISINDNDTLKKINDLLYKKIESLYKKSEEKKEVQEEEKSEVVNIKKLSDDFLKEAFNRLMEYNNNNSNESDMQKDNAISNTNEPKEINIDISTYFNEAMRYMTYSAEILKSLSNATDDDVIVKSIYDTLISQMKILEEWLLTYDTNK